MRSAKGGQSAGQSAGPSLTAAFAAMPAIGLAAVLLGASATAAKRPVGDLHASVRQPALPQCQTVRLSASYLAEAAPREGPGFLITVANYTAEDIKLAEPFPSSAHWYAETPGGKWLWRASSGFGGALVNAMNERGPLFGYRPGDSAVRPLYLTVPAHGQRQWAEPVHANPILSYRPGCERCRNPGDAQFRAVLAYAYLPPEGSVVPGLLLCGLRSNLVVMPPPR